MFELAVRIVGQAMPAGLIVRAGAVHRGVVLGDVKIDRPGTQGGGELFQRLVELAACPSSRNSAGSMASSGAL